MNGVESVSSAEPAATSRQRLTGAGAVRAHVTVIVGLALCAAAFSFELNRALGGNSLSWAYVFEWPLLGGFAVYMWWNILYPDRQSGRQSRKPRPETAPQYAGMLAAWQEHQLHLEATRTTALPEGDNSSIHEGGLN